MILSDKDIMQFIKLNELNIEPFSEKNLTPNGYDLSIAEIVIPTFNIQVKEGTATIPPKSWFGVSTKEYIRLGRKVTAQLWIRSSYARKGIICSFGKVDAGFEGTLTLSSFNASDSQIEINIGETFAQIVFEELRTPAQKVYGERSGSYLGQKGLVLEKMSSKKKEKPCKKYKCSECCKKTEMILTNEDVDRLTHLGFDKNFFVKEDDGWLVLKNKKGQCVFLEDGLCSVYAYRPAGCRTYPLVYDNEKCKPLLDLDCPYKDEFPINEQHTKQLASLVDILISERKERMKSLKNLKNHQKDA